MDNNCGIQDEEWIITVVSRMKNDDNCGIMGNSCGIQDEKWIIPVVYIGRRKNINCGKQNEKWIIGVEYRMKNG